MTNELAQSGEDLFILDIANNHFGDVGHAKSLISRASEVIHSEEVRGAIKFQFRNLDTYLSEQGIRDNGKYVQRFMSTRLSKENFFGLVQHVKSEGLLAMATPFDEESISWVLDSGCDVIKIASASADDWSLVDATINCQLPIVASTGGLSLRGVDNLHHTLMQGGASFALMHCVSVYPSPNDLLELNQIVNFLGRYPNVRVGWSTHENPDHTHPVVIAKSLGASLFERHIGLPSSKYQLNEYSSSPKQLEGWIRAYKTAKESLGSIERLPRSEAEIATVKTLKRAWYVADDIEAGMQISASNLKLQFPTVRDDQLTASEVPMGTAQFALQAESPATKDAIKIFEQDGLVEHLVDSHLFEIRATLAMHSVNINSKSEFSLSHHLGMARFREFGCALITEVNRDYAKKIIVLLPRQKNPVHKHNNKEEMIQLLHGDVDLSIDGVTHSLKPGDMRIVPRGSWHKFQSNHGAILEEVSTTHDPGDSFYEDVEIQNNPHRKTQVENWRDFLDWVQA